MTEGFALSRYQTHTIKYSRWLGRLRTALLIKIRLTNRNPFIRINLQNYGENSDEHWPPDPDLLPASSFGH